MRVKAFILSINGLIRSSNLLSTLDELSIPFEIIENGDINRALEHWKTNGSKGHKRRQVTNNQRSCTYGHRLMYESSQKDQGQYDYFLFLEDDVVLDVNAINIAFGDRWSFTPAFILLGSCGGWALRQRISLGKNAFCHKTFSDSVCGSHAYLANRIGVDALLKGTNNLERLMDEFFRVPRISMFIIYPFVAFQEGLSPTTIPMVSGSGSRNFFRKFLSSAYDDVLDLFYYKKFGTRMLSLPELEQFFCLFLQKLPGCNFQDSQID